MATPTSRLDLDPVGTPFWRCSGTPSRNGRFREGVQKRRFWGGVAFLIKDYLSQNKGKNISKRGRFVPPNGTWVMSYFGCMVSGGFGRFRQKSEFDPKNWHGFGDRFGIVTKRSNQIRYSVKLVTPTSSTFQPTSWHVTNHHQTFDECHQTFLTCHQSLIGVSKSFMSVVKLF